MRVLVTCPPMLGMIDEFRGQFEAHGLELVTPKVVQVMTEAQLIDLVPSCDGWIIGDDPATAAVFAAGAAGRLAAAVKWGIGVDNVDLAAAESQGIRITNTPGMFGEEVADLAVCYIVGLAREAFFVDREVRNGGWPKPAGISLSGRTAGLVGFGDIGRQLSRRLQVLGMRQVVYDPQIRESATDTGLPVASWPERIDELDFLVFACSLTASNRHMFDAAVLDRVTPGLRLVNVSRGPLLDEAVLAQGLADGRIRSAALDVMETEPLPLDSPLRAFPSCIFGSHNASNTRDAVRRTSHRAMAHLFDFLGTGNAS